MKEKVTFRIAGVDQTIKPGEKARLDIFVNRSKIVLASRLVLALSFSSLGFSNLHLKILEYFKPNANFLAR